jgi:hypothetical protein
VGRSKPLIGAVGSCAAAASAVRADAGLLRTRTCTLAESMPALVEVLGEAGAREAVAKHHRVVRLSCGCCAPQRFRVGGVL